MWIVILAMVLVAPQDLSVQLQARQKRSLLLKAASASQIPAKGDRSNCIGLRRHLNCRSASEKNMHEV
jgi:hypothetical protein